MKRRKKEERYKKIEEDKKREYRFHVPEVTYQRVSLLEEVCTEVEGTNDMKFLFQ